MLSNSATEEQDYVPINREVYVFQPDVEAIEVGVQLVDDDIVEPEESFVLVLSSADNNGIDEDRKQTAVIVKDDDGRCLTLTMWQARVDDRSKR